MVQPDYFLPPYCDVLGLFSFGQFLGEGLVYITFRQGVFPVKKNPYTFSVRRIDFLDSIKSHSVAELKITLIGHGVSE